MLLLVELCVDLWEFRGGGGGGITAHVLAVLGCPVLRGYTSIRKFRALPAWMLLDVCVPVGTTVRHVLRIRRLGPGCAMLNSLTPYPPVLGRIPPSLPSLGV